MGGVVAGRRASHYQYQVAVGHEHGGPTGHMYWASDAGSGG